MSTLVGIQAPARRLPAPPSWRTSFELGFRPFCLAGAVLYLWRFSFMMIRPQPDKER